MGAGRGESRRVRYHEHGRGTGHNKPRDFVASLLVGALGDGAVPAAALRLLIAENNSAGSRDEAPYLERILRNAKALQEAASAPASSAEVKLLYRRMRDLGQRFVDESATINEDQLPQRFLSLFHGVGNAHLANIGETGQTPGVTANSLRALSREAKWSLAATGLVPDAANVIVLPLQNLNYHWGGVYLPNLGAALISEGSIAGDPGAPDAASTKRIITHEIIHSLENFDVDGRSGRVYGREVAFLREGLVEWLNRYHLHGDPYRSGTPVVYLKETLYVDGMLRRLLPTSTQQERAACAQAILADAAGLDAVRTTFDLDLAGALKSSTQAIACIQHEDRVAKQNNMRN